MPGIHSLQAPNRPKFEQRFDPWKEEVTTMTKVSTERSTRPRRSKQQSVAHSPASEAQSDFVMMRFGRIEEMDRSFDIEFWQRQGDAAIFRAAWELVESYCRDRGIDPDELRLQRTVETFQRP
jgi:hypothetical protein